MANGKRWAQMATLGGLFVLAAGAVRWGGHGMAGHATGDESGGCGGGAPGSAATTPRGGDAGTSAASGIAAVTVTQLRIDAPFKDPATGDPLLALEYPVDSGIKLHVTWKDPSVATATRIPVSLAFGEQTGTGFCIIGAFVATTTGKNLSADFSEDVSVSQRFFLAPQCLYDAQGTVNPTLRRTMNPILTIDPNDDLGLSDDITYSPAHAKDPDVLPCDANPANATADSCVQDYVVTDSPGIDVEVEKISLKTSVVVLDDCPANDAAAQKASPACTKALVRDASGSWVQAAPDMLANVSLWLYGAPNRGSGDGLVNALGGKPEKLTYSFRPASSTGDADWEPLYLHAKPTPRAGGPRVPPTTIDHQEEASHVAMTKKVVHQGLYIEGSPRTDVVSGKWKDQSRFVVRACASSDAEGTSARRDNNCRSTGFRIVRTPRAQASAGMTTQLKTMATSASSSLAFNESWSDTQGDTSIFALGESFSTQNSLDTSGATSDSSGDVSVSSGLFSSFDLVDAWADAQALVAISGSNYDYGIKVFGDKLWGDSATADNLAYSNDKLSWSKDVPYTFSYYILSATLDFSGTIGLPFGLTMSAVNGGGLGYPNATQVGEVVASLTPTVSFDVTGNASVDLVVYEGGLEGSLTLIQMTVPVTATAIWGLETLTSMDVQAQGEVDLDLSTMSGSLDLYVKQYDIDWCKKWHIPYPCGHSWDVIWDYTIVSFSGWHWDETIWKQDLLNETLTF